MDQGLGVSVSPGHHWRESLSLPLDSLEGPVQTTMVPVFPWRPLVPRQAGGERWL